jgi:RNA polymerase sigma-70 factor, ECF subfamily
MSSTAARYFLRATVREESAAAGVQSLQSRSGEEPKRITARSAPSDELAHSGTHPPCRADFSDEALLSLICRGREEALSLLFRHYARIVRGVAYRVLRDASEADDLLQDIFLLVHRLAGSFDSSKGSARFWILQMTYRRAISRRRYLTSRHFYTRVDLDAVETELADPRNPATEIEELIDAARGNGSLQKVFEELSENQQQTLKLFFVEGYTFDEIAAKLGQSRGNIKNHYFRGLDKLRKHIFSGKLAGPGAV